MNGGVFYQQFQLTYSRENLECPCNSKTNAKSVEHGNLQLMTMTNVTTVTMKITSSDSAKEIDLESGLGEEIFIILIVLGARASLGFTLAVCE